ncbi:SusC/RagA family TonB-linked outer membrane protein [Dysgonomonas sp. 511]|uniref:SusC/RagA family TonB-linked outer membrane protein n=1 Tax=Dysgonomonas sp. 511 TaxID=2302930 RepID=UPI0013D4A0F5|nr:SusC/RagA family TonB-linked outer membrane protein [Dysgonomonas sp. 511]NDV77674.1 SusC/RagA family TonB-linked outer membrane protein [Dysgonomonas sp. 511]
MRKLGVLILCLFIGTFSMLAQTQNVKGLVQDENGEPIIGASVSVKGTTTGTLTDVDGRFSINVPANVKVLSFSFIGYEVLDAAISPQMTVKMKPSAQQLDEVVVTGMVRTDKRLFTGATDQLKGENVKIDGMAEISRGLEGRSAGVSVQNVSGTFGTAPKIRVRGATSIYGDSKPLWVVDGVIMEDIAEVSADDLSSGDAITLVSSAIAGLNPDDIENFQILKDGSATSIYGARAMAGVIVVTTKRGRAGTSSINYTGEYTMRLKPSYRNFNIMNSQEQMGVYKEMEQKGWLTYAKLNRAASSGVYGYMYDLFNYDPVTGTYPMENTPEMMNQYLRSAEMRNTDWFDELFQTNIMHNHSVGVTAGTEKTQFYGSLSAMFDPGWSKQSKVSRYTTNLNVTHRVLPNLSINLGANASYRKQKAPGTLSQELDVVSGEVRRDFDINPYSYALNTSRALDKNTYYKRNYAPFNILHELDNNYMDLNIVDLRINGEMRWKVIPDFEISMLGAIKYQSLSQEHNILDESNQALAYRAMPDAEVRDNNPFLYTDPDKLFSLPVSILPEGGIYQRTDMKMLGYDFRLAGDYMKTFNHDHIVKIYGGMELNSVERKKTWFNGWGLQYSMGEIPFYTYQFFKKGIEDGSDYFSMAITRGRIASFFANPTYSYQGKYTVSGTVRYEGTNKLGKSRKSRWLPTWNISGAWNAHEEKFFKDLKPTLSHLTLKASYSLTGDSGPASVTNSRIVLKSFNTYRPFAADKESGLEISDLENSELTYEKKHELNIGASVGFLNNRINLDVDWFKRNNYDLIGPTSTMGIGGQITKYANVADMKSHGIEVSISTKNITTRDFSWTTDLVFSNIKTEVTKLDSRSRVFDYVTNTGFTREGYPSRALFSIPFKGLNEDGIPTFLDQSGNVTVDGIYFQERNNVDFLIYEGPTDPTTSGGLGNLFRYKNFKLNVFMTYAFGNVVRLDPVFSSSYTDLTSMPKEFKNRWTLPGEEKQTDVPVILNSRQVYNNSKLSYAYNAYNYSDVRIAKGDFIRLKEVSLTYDFPKQWIAPHINNLSLKLQATNLFLLYADKKLNGQDPEFFRSGGVSAPVPKQFTLTLRLGL